jgi:AraC family transcriptional regulator
VAHASFDFGAGLETYDLSAGAMRIFDGRRACRANDWSCRSARRIMVELDAGRMGEPELLAGLRQDLHFRDDGLAGLVRAMAREIGEGCPHGSLYAETLSLAVLQRVARTHGCSRPERGMLTALQLRRVDDLIADASGAGPTLGELAAATCYSRAQFVRLFRRTTGTSPHRYVRQRRLERARALIVSSSMSLAEVATLTGFSSQSHLNDAFLRSYGCTPGAARREAGCRVADAQPSPESGR